MSRRLENPHYEEDGRCGYCYEEWPCQQDPLGRSALQQWEWEARNREWEADKQRRRGRAVRVNYMLVSMGYTRSQLEIDQDAVGQMVDTDLLCSIIERLAAAEGIEVPT